MTFADVLKSPSSNIGTTLSASALAITATLSPSPLRAEEAYQRQPVAWQQFFETPTDLGFVLLDSPRTEAVEFVGSPVRKAFVHPYREQGYKVRLFDRTDQASFPNGSPVVLGESPLDLIPSSFGGSLKLAAGFYQDVAAEAKSDLLWDLVVLSYVTKAPPPAIEVIDGSVTVDFSAAGRLLSILIDGDTCFVSSFGQHKEVRATFSTDLEAEDELTDLVWTQLRDFQRKA